MPEASNREVEKAVEQNVFLNHAEEAKARFDKAERHSDEWRQSYADTINYLNLAGHLSDEEASKRIKLAYFDSKALNESSPFKNKVLKLFVEHHLNNKSTEHIEGVKSKNIWRLLSKMGKFGLRAKDVFHDSRGEVFWSMNPSGKRIYIPKKDRWKEIRKYDENQRNIHNRNRLLETKLMLTNDRGEGPVFEEGLDGQLYVKGKTPKLTMHSLDELGNNDEFHTLFDKKKKN